ncbi:glutamate racemase [Arcobacter sp. YIC-310]|uniref:glutamate racemase n=1 Tax=Arcobacter sp. YIC-310 TaxID=3376632 RepID=UPI003C1EE97C
MKVGVFDSGLGGLTVVNAIKDVFNGADIFYIADTAYAPYGVKTHEQILQRCIELTNYFIKKHDIEVLIVACNTATSAAIKHLRENFPFLMVIGTEPGIKPAIQNSKSLSVGVLATPATLKGAKYQTLVDSLARNKKVKLFEQECPGLVEQIEKGRVLDKDTNEMLKKWLQPMKENGVDTIVLGCTHYPLVSQAIKTIMGESINLVQTGEAIANRLLSLSSQKGHNNLGDLKISICYTGEINKNMVDMIFREYKKQDEIMVRKCEV